MDDARSAWPAPLPPPSGAPVPLRRPRRWPARAGAAALVATALVFDRSPLVVVALLFVLVVPFERFFPRHRQPLRRPGLATDLAFALAAPALRVGTLAVGVVVGVVSLAWLPGLALRPLVMALPPLVRAVAGAVAFDLLVYWMHRFAHEVPFLWRFHAVHHSPARLDWISGLRVHPLDGAFLTPPIVFLLAAGVPAEVTGALAVVQLATGLFLHANVRWRLRPLQRVVATPEFHHWHHADEPAAHHTNYASFLPLWDQLFGTYRVPADRRPERYGIGEPMPTRFVDQLRYPWRDLPGPVRLARTGVRHPLRSARRLGGAARTLVAQMAASARRPVRAGAAAQPPS